LPFSKNYVGPYPIDFFASTKRKKPICHSQLNLKKLPNYIPLDHNQKKKKKNLTQLNLEKAFSNLAVFNPTTGSQPLLHPLVLPLYFNFVSSQNSNILLFFQSYGEEVKKITENVTYNYTTKKIAIRHLQFAMCMGPIHVANCSPRVICDVWVMW
jgi:hypothetical protein